VNNFIEIYKNVVRQLNVDQEDDVRHQQMEEGKIYF
jgi:hypothetical protein